MPSLWFPNPGGRKILQALWQVARGVGAKGRNIFSYRPAGPAASTAHSIKASARESAEKFAGVLVEAGNKKIHSARRTFIACVGGSCVWLFQFSKTRGCKTIGRRVLVRWYSDSN